MIVNYCMVIKTTPRNDQSYENQLLRKVDKCSITYYGKLLTFVIKLSISNLIYIYILKLKNYVSYAALINIQRVKAHDI